ncbi:alpha/beta hydrolase family protein [Streptomyces sp. NPDC059352]|uniref:alpha/beta hydrolase family protein n=1 Tax=Streptomyces sp. NPDC059352 TaxID=3346810 RepID=UPI00367B338C
MFVLPLNSEGRLRAVSFAHGTGSHRDDSPSTQRVRFVSAPVIAHASAGAAGVAPDYLGMGKGPGRPPWMDIDSETTASLDMLRAARAFASRTGHALEREVMVTGFSQGASAALGLGRALEAGEDRWFRLGALAPVSGAYDFGGAELPALLEGRLEPKSSVLYAAYTLVAFNRLHPTYDRPGEVFRAPYDSTVEALFDGAHTGEQLMRGTPGALDELLTGPAASCSRTRRAAGGGAARDRRRMHRLGTACPSTALHGGRGRAGRHRQHRALPGGSARQRRGRPGRRSGRCRLPRFRHLGSNVAATSSIVRWFGLPRRP